MRLPVLLWPAVTLTCISAADPCAAGEPAGRDWPHWRGPDYDGVARETGLLQSWPAGGPQVLWKIDLTGGYSSVTVAKGRLFTQARRGKHETVLCLDAATGRQHWEFRYRCDYGRHRTLDTSFRSGPRATPTVAGKRVYALGTTGLLHCLDVQSGKKLWRRDLCQLGRRRCPQYGYSSSPLVVGRRLFVHPGGPKGRSIAALDRRTGRTLWRALGDPVGYATPVPIRLGGSLQVVYFTARGAVGVRPADGKVRWRQPWKTTKDLNVATPIYARRSLFLSSNYGKGAALVRLRARGKPHVVWKSPVMQNWFSTSVLYRGHVYGFSGSRLRCVEFATGKKKWDKTGLGQGSVLVADGRLIVLGERGTLVLAEATPRKYVETGRCRPLRGVCWTVPVVAHGRLYVRSPRQLVALDVRSAQAFHSPFGRAAGIFGGDADPAALSGCGARSRPRGLSPEMPCPTAPRLPQPPTATCCSASWPCKWTSSTAMPWSRQ
jgi:outer membrane protein assembly factor BamB